MNALRFKVTVTAIALAGSFGAAAAHAAGLYVGGSVGAPHFGDSVNGIAGNGSDVSGKVFGGYQLTPNFAIEGGATDLGHIESRSGTVKAHGAYLDAVGFLPLGNSWALLGSVGIARVNLDTSNGDDSGSGLKLGLGAEYALSRNVDLRGEWEQYRPSAFDDRIPIDQYTFGVRVNF